MGCEICRNSELLADAIFQAIDEKNRKTILWENRRENCRERIIQNFSLDKMVTSYKREMVASF